MKKYNEALIEAILKINKIEVDKTRVEQFVNIQIHQMPDYLKQGILLLSFLFNNLMYLFYLQSFANISLKKRMFIVSFIQQNNIFILYDLVRFYKSIVLLKSIELEQK